ncbi:unnamed protein product, partial [Eruca vesicaria subsp. sativa]|nr:unnamed protein product [Eruca vesicaria subsp. sativa]
MGCHASHGRAGVKAHVDNKLLQVFHCYCGQTYTFQLKLGEFNFTSKHYTISRIATEQQCAQLPKFVIHEDNHGSDDDKPEEKPVELKGSSGYQNADAEVAG